MAAIRIDKLISSCLVMSRKDAISLIKKGRVCIDGTPVKTADTKADPDKNTIEVDGKAVLYSEYIYIMLNKPKGLVCAANDARDKTVLSLFDKSYADKGLFSCGRLDKDTTGLLLMTTDGALSHKLLSPKHHAEKVYFVKTDLPFTEDDVLLMKNGIMMDGKMTKPAILEITENPTESYITLTEGKYHEIKRLCYACGRKEVLELHRTSFAGLTLDENLEKGQWRYLTKEEIAIILANGE